MVVPAADAVIACTAQVDDMQAQLDLIWEHLLPALSGQAAADSAAEARLSDRLAALSTAAIDARTVPSHPEATFARTGEPALFTEGLDAAPGGARG